MKIPFLQKIWFIFSIFSDFSRLKPNLSKCEITSIVVLKGVQVAVCNMRCKDLNNDTLKIFGSHFCYNETLKRKKNLSHNCNKCSTSTESTEMRNLTVEVKIVIFKTSVLSKIILQPSQDTS